VALLSDPLGYFLTWRTYGTWLPGDERGWIDRTRNGHGEPTRPPDWQLENIARTAMSGKPFVFDDRLRAAVTSIINDKCAFEGWSVSAINVRTNHVHLVVTAGNRPAAVVNALKSRTTRVLRENGYVADGIPIWSRGASLRQLWDEAAVAAAVEYVLHGQ
jgi:REP element-mobilizing transposase RayT